MNKIFSFLLFNLMTSLFSAQSADYKTAVDLFHTHYNSGNYKSIFNSFSPEMQNALPLENTKQFLLGLKLQFGKIESKEFSSYQETYAGYKTKFEKALLSVNISLDDNNKINGLLVRPFEKKKKSKQVS